MQLPSIQNADLKGKRVVLRFDGDVPVENGVITDDYRLKAVLPTIQFCRQQGASVVLLAHRGRPEGKPDPELSTRILEPYLTQALGEPVGFASSLLEGVPGQPLVLVENVRFYRGEEENQAGFAKLLARLGDVYCNDAFAVSHRAHASLEALPHLLPHYAGFRFLEEIAHLTPLRDGPESPYCLVLGGAKADDKAPVVQSMIDKMDSLLIGGLVAVTYLAARGVPTGAHKLDASQVKLAQDCIRQMQEEEINLCVPVDFVNQQQQIKPVTHFAKDDLMLDIGPQTQDLYARTLHKANTIFWNGAMGKFEEPAYASGTLGVARSMANSGAESRVASGGDTVAAIDQHNLQNSFTFISSGGGATLEFIAGEELPGIKALQT